MSSRLSSSEFELSQSLAALHVVSPRGLGEAVRCVTLASRGAGRGWCGRGPPPPPIRSRPRSMRPDNPIPYALDSAGRPVRTPHLRERRWRLRASRPRADTGVFSRATTSATHLIASPPPPSPLQEVHSFVRPPRSHSSVPTASLVRRRAQTGFKAGRRPPEGLGLDTGEHGATLDRSGRRTSHAAARVLAVLRVAPSGTSPSSR
jgi:hypothetical protein